jgi:hypothetical protein
MIKRGKRRTKLEHREAKQAKRRRPGSKLGGWTTSTAKAARRDERVDAMYIKLNISLVEISF